jgi:hypothetical protein
MRISHRHKFIFLAVPRTGSTTVRDVLDPYSEVKSVHYTETTRDVPFYHHISASELKAVFESRGWVWEDYRKFCVVRNPYDRVVSLYHHYLGLRKRPFADKTWFERCRDGLTRRLSFRDYVLRLDTGKHLSTTVERFIGDGEGGRLVEDILRFETLNEELPKWLAESGIRISSSEIPHLNASEARGKYRAYYDDVTKEKVLELYGFDIRRFGYTF